MHVLVFLFAYVQFDDSNSIFSLLDPLPSPKTMLLTDTSDEDLTIGAESQTVHKAFHRNLKHRFQLPEVFAALPKPNKAIA